MQRRCSSLGSHEQHTTAEPRSVCLVAFAMAPLLTHKGSKKAVVKDTLPKSPNPAVAIANASHEQRIGWKKGILNKATKDLESVTRGSVIDVADGPPARPLLNVHDYDGTTTPLDDEAPDVTTMIDAEVQTRSWESLYMEVRTEYAKELLAHAGAYA